MLNEQKQDGENKINQEDLHLILIKCMETNKNRKNHYQSRPTRHVKSHEIKPKIQHNHMHSRPESAACRCRTSGSRSCREWRRGKSTRSTASTGRRSRNTG